MKTAKYEKNKMISSAVAKAICRNFNKDGIVLIKDILIEKVSINLRDLATKLETDDREHLNKTVQRTHYHYYKTGDDMGFYAVFGLGSILKHENDPMYQSGLRKMKLGNGEL